MNLDAMIDERRPEWDRLDALARRKRLTGPETDEFVHLYRSASADLADIKTSVGRTAAGDYVSNILATARLKLTGAPDNVARQIPRFFARQLPAALYRIRWLTLVIAAVFIGIVALVGWWAQQDPAYMAALGDEADLKQYAEEDFVAYYSEHAEGVFAGMVWSNNAWIAAQAIMFGITGIWPVYVIMQNATGLGVSAAVMNWFGHGDDFLLFILPHGLLEMTCIFVAGAAGMRIFWAWIAPGARTRAAA
ncbi:MAG: stage II sporulation protein M, partial [Microbacterium gubbeenense]